MISNLPDDVVHDLLRDLGNSHIGHILTDYCDCGEELPYSSFEKVKHIIEQWEEKRDKYLKSVHKYQPPRSVYNVRHHEDSPFKMPDGSGFFVP